MAEKNLQNKEMGERQRPMELEASMQRIQVMQQHLVDLQQQQEP
jgi:hypothetical protein